jgi:hypothetical protein
MVAVCYLPYATQSFHTKGIWIYSTLCAHHGTYVLSLAELLCVRFFRSLETRH